MNLSVIILVVFLTTLSTLSARHIKRRHRNDQRLGSVNYETNTNLNPWEEQRLEKYTKELKDRYNRKHSMRDQDEVLIFNKHLLNLIKTFPLSLHLLRIKDKLRREHDRIVHMFDQEPENEDYKESNKCDCPSNEESENEYYDGFRSNGEESENEDYKVARNGFRPDYEESYHEDYGEQNSEELKNEHNTGTIQIIMPDSEELKNESNKGVSEGYRSNGEESGTEDYKVTSEEGKNKGHQLHNETLPNEGNKKENKSNGIQSHNEVLQTENFKGNNNSYWLNNEIVKVDPNYKSSHGVLKHKGDAEIEKYQEAIKGNSVESQTESGKLPLKSHKKRRKLMNPYYYTTKNKKIKKKVKYPQ